MQAMAAPKSRPLHTYCPRQPLHRFTPQIRGIQVNRSISCSSQLPDARLVACGPFHGQQLAAFPPLLAGGWIGCVAQEMKQSSPHDRNGSTVIAAWMVQAGAISVVEEPAAAAVLSSTTTPMPLPSAYLETLDGAGGIALEAASTRFGECDRDAVILTREPMRWILGWQAL